MVRDTGIFINQDALRHNLQQVQSFAPHKKVIAMVKANAYGCGIEKVVPAIFDTVQAFGVAFIGEALAIRARGIQTECILFEGIFSSEELHIASQQNMPVVLHAPWQLNLLLETPLSNPVTVWIKIDSGMHRLGFPPDEIAIIYQQLQACRWVKPKLGLMSHFACADIPEHRINHQQLNCFNQLCISLKGEFSLSMANSAAIISNPASHFDYVRPGIMLYGASPFEDQFAHQFNLHPVMQFRARILDIHQYTEEQPIGYGATWYTKRSSRIAVVTAGYGDGYPRHIKEGTMVWVAGQSAPIVGRVSMDLLTIDVTDCPQVEIGDPVELWGDQVPVELVAKQAGTIAYELLCQYKARSIK